MIQSRPTQNDQKNLGDGVQAIPARVQNSLVSVSEHTQEACKELWHVLRIVRLGVLTVGVKYSYRCPSSLYCLKGETFKLLLQSITE